eukprot:6482612-Amphidinium_carterae.1
MPDYASLSIEDKRAVKEAFLHNSLENCRRAIQARETRAVEESTETIGEWLTYDVLLPKVGGPEGFERARKQLTSRTHDISGATEYWWET